MPDSTPDDTDDGSPSPPPADGGHPERRLTPSHAPGGEESPVRYDVPADADPVSCDRCGRPFTSDSLLALHRGLAHGDAISADERSTYAETHDAETRRLRRFRLKVLGVLVVLYFGTLMIYALVV